MISLWASTEAQIKQAAEFFLKHVEPDYISHGEVQSGRAQDFQTWSVNALDVLIEDFREALGDHALLAIASEGDEIVGIAFMSIFRNSRACFAVFEDVLTRPDSRSKGVATSLYQWIEKELITKGVTTIFLESGVKNSGAHHFLHGLGFETCSFVMSKKLS